MGIRAALGRSAAFLLLASQAAWSDAQQPPGSPGPPSPPVVRFSGSTLDVEKVTAGGSVLLFGRVTTFVDFTMQQIRVTEALLDEDRDGVVRYDFATEIPETSLWAVVDLTTGEFSVATPAPQGPREVRFPPGALVADERSAAARLVDEREAFDVVVARPGEGAWRRTVGDAGAHDEDGEPDGRVTLSFASMDPVGGHGKPAPQGLEEKDVVLVIDPDRLVFYGARMMAGGAK